MLLPVLAVLLGAAYASPVRNATLTMGQNSTLITYQTFYECIAIPTSVANILVVAADGGGSVSADTGGSTSSTGTGGAYSSAGAGGSSLTTGTGTFSPTLILPCLDCYPEIVWALTTESAGALSIVANTPTAIQVITSFPCLICPSENLTILVDQKITVDDIPDGFFSFTDKDLDDLIQDLNSTEFPALSKRVSLPGTTVQSANVSIMGFDDSWILPRSFGHNGGSNTSLVITDLDLSQGFTSLLQQQAAQECSDYYYSTIAPNSKAFRSQPLTITVENFDDKLTCYFDHVIFSAANYVQKGSNPSQFAVAISRGPCTFEGEWVNIISSRTCWWNEYGTTRWVNDFIAANATDTVPFFPSFMAKISNTWSTMDTRDHRPIKLECHLGTGCQGFQDDIPKTDASDDEINVFLVLTALQQFALLQQLNYQAFVDASNWARGQIGGVFEEFKRNDPPTSSTAIFDFFFDLAEDAFSFLPFGGALEVIVGIAASNTLSNFIEIASPASPKNVVTPNLDDMSRFVADLIQEKQRSAQAGYELVLGQGKSTMKAMQSTLALEAWPFKIVSTNETWYSAVQGYEHALMRFSMSKAMEVNKIMLQKTELGLGIPNMPGSKFPLSSFGCCTILTDIADREYPDQSYRVYPVTYNSADDTDRDRFSYGQIDAVDKFKDRSDATLDDIYAGALACQKIARDGQLPYITKSAWYAPWDRTQGLKNPDCLWNLPVIDMDDSQALAQCHNWSDNELHQYYHYACSHRCRTSSPNGADYGTYSYWGLMVNGVHNDGGDGCNNGY